MKKGLMVSGLLIVMIGFSVAWGSMVASAASQHDWLGVAFGLFVLICAILATGVVFFSARARRF